MSDTELVLFDLDGTLIDTAPDMVPALNELLECEGRPALPYERLRVHVSHGSTGLLEQAWGTGLPGPEFERLRGLFLQRYRARLALASVPFPGVDRLLAEIDDRGMHWGVVTNKPAWLTEPLLAELGLYERAACVVSGDTLAARKPDPAPLLHACALARVPPARTVYVGDAERDIVAARAAGMPGFVALFGYIDPGDDPTRWGATALLQTPDDLWRHLPGPAIATQP